MHSIFLYVNMSCCKATVAVQILNDQEARFNSADLNIAYKMNVDEYQKLCPYSGELEANWGKAPGNCPALLCVCWLMSLRCPVLRCAMLCCACCAMLWCAMLWCAMLCCAAACNGCTVLLSLVYTALQQLTWHALTHCNTVSKQQSIQRPLKQFCSAQS